MSAIVSSLHDSRFQGTMSGIHKLSSPISHDGANDRRMSSANEGFFTPTTLLLRKLPRYTTAEAVRTMLLFAKDLQDTEIISSEYEEDHGFTTAVARFSSVNGASEAQKMLDGKPNTVGQANMIVELVSIPMTTASGRRNTIDPTSTRGVGSPVSPQASHLPKSSRFNGTFQSIEKLSPSHMGSSPEHSSPESNSHMQSIFAPRSPVVNTIQDRSRVSGKSVIGEDDRDEDTDGLLNDPLAYIKYDNNVSPYAGRKGQNMRPPVASFNSLSLNTGTGSTHSGYTSPRSAITMHTPNTPFSPNGNVYQAGNQYLRHNYPPVNPADQNPPCNTLYVGNLPIDTSEDELKAMFSKQRGYKRLCFRTKQNGPMCFVEFEDVSFATKALNDLYGAQLHNSVKGGIRLSFSKNPLGVRSGQPGSTNSSIPMSPTGPVTPNGMNTMSSGSFSTANGPPPGLSVPLGFNATNSNSNSAHNNQYVPQTHSPANMSIQGVRGMQINGNGGNASNSGGYPDYMMGR